MLEPAQVQTDTALLAFSLGPVQPFIAAARTLRDLWSGSYVLAWLTAQAMLPVVQAHGPDAVIFPYIQENPLFQWWLRQAEGQAPDGAEAAARLTPCLPNRFLAEAPVGEDGQGAVKLAKRCEDRVRQAWRELAEGVQNALTQRLGKDKRLEAYAASWNADLWREQIEHFFDIQVVAAPRAPYSAAVIEALPGVRRPSASPNETDLWPSHWDIALQLLEAAKQIRHIPAYKPVGDAPPGCSLLGNYEQMGPANLHDASRFWEAMFESFKQHSEQGTRLGRRDRLCAISLVKRLAWPVYFAPTYQLRAQARRYADTATIAAAHWLIEAGLDPEATRQRHQRWSGQWLHWPNAQADDDEDDCPSSLFSCIQKLRSSARHGPPPTYYAVVAMDGDQMGDKLRGARSRDAHQAISRALAHFALRLAPQTVSDARGELIYAGGDDVLAALPARGALACALQLAQQFAANWSAYGLDADLGPASMSCGLAIAHYKEDLRFALNMARQAEAAAKAAGRNALVIRICRRSGEHSAVLCPWDFVDTAQRWTSMFANGASDRWTYHLAAEADTLGGLGVEPAVTAEIKRLVRRSALETRARMGETQALQAADRIAGEFESLGALLHDENRQDDLASRLTTFVTLCQSAAFLARGRDA